MRGIHWKRSILNEESRHLRLLFMHIVAISTECINHPLPFHLLYDPQLNLIKKKSKWSKIVKDKHATWITDFKLKM